MANSRPPKSTVPYTSDATPGASPADLEALHRTRLHEILHHVPTVMLLTRDAANKTSGRPMGLIRIDDDETMYFTTAIDSDKIAEVMAHPDVAISVQRGDAFAMVSGRAEVRQDRALIGALWQDAWKAWYPQGKDDPSIAIIVVTPLEATYWEQSIGTGLSLLFRMMKASIKGQPLELHRDDEAHVDLRVAPPA